MTPEALAREYYRSLDDHDYEALKGILSPEFVQERGDRTFRGREAFVSFMREDRPETETEHVIDRIYTGPTGVAVRGRLLRESGDPWFEFVDVFEVGDRLEHLVTFTA